MSQQTTQVTPPESANKPVSYRRDSGTGLIIGKEYKYTPEGRIDYRAMVDRRFLYIASEYEERVVKQQGKPLAEVDLLLVKDDWLRIRVGGLNQLAHLRGVRSCTYPILECRDGFAAAVCQIEFIPNVETGMMPETWSGTASANLKSVDRQFTPYLETFAENRAFSRCIKRALQINILSDIEVGGDSRSAANGTGQEAAKDESLPSNEPVGFHPYHLLAQTCASQKKPISFDALKAAAIKHNTDVALDAKDRIKADPTTWTSFESIDPIDAYLLLSKIEEKNKAEAKAAAVVKKTKP
jgi:hypothetical protein